MIPRTAEFLIETMRDFDRPARVIEQTQRRLMHRAKPMSPKAIRELRECSELSQAGFADFLGLPVEIVEKWELGRRRPIGPVLMLLNMINRNPELIEDREPIKAISAQEIKELRLEKGQTSGVFAACLHTASRTVKKWENGTWIPTGPALKLLNLIQRDPTIIYD